MPTDSMARCELPDTGDIEADLRTWLHGQAEYFGSPRNVALSRALAVASADNSARWRRPLQPARATRITTSLLRRLRGAVHTGDIRADVDLEAVADAMIGATLYRILTHVRTVEETTKRLRRPRRRPDPRAADLNRRSRA